MSKQITPEDQRRVNNCEYYLRTKQVMLNHKAYKNFDVGEVYFVKRVYGDGKQTYVGVSYGSDTKLKYMIFHKDDGFVFAKRIIASGKLGKDVTCLTTTYDVGSYILEPDPEYVNSLLLDDGEGYDPLTAAKELTSKKNKARRRNKKMELKFPTAQEAYDYIKRLRKGDKLYDASTAYGSGIVEWDVTKVTVRKTDKTKQESWYGGATKYGNTYEDQLHNDAGFDQLVEVELKVNGTAPPSRRWMNTTQKLHFTNFHKAYHSFYGTKPFTVDDV